MELHRLKTILSFAKPDFHALMAKPRIVILAGLSGAAKTTASKHLVRDALGIGEFVAADIIAA